MKSVMFIWMCLLSFNAIMMGQGEVNIQYSNGVDAMMQSFISKNKSTSTVKGWRIQIITTDDRRKMEAAKSKFEEMYPDVPLEWNHIAPYYRVKVGAYENKMQLMGFLLELKEFFPAVIPVMDDIEKSELVQ